MKSSDVNKFIQRQKASWKQRKFSKFSCWQLEMRKHASWNSKFPSPWVLLQMKARNHYAIKIQRLRDSIKFLSFTAWAITPGEGDKKGRINRPFDDALLLGPRRSRLIKLAMVRLGRFNHSSHSLARRQKPREQTAGALNKTKREERTKPIPSGAGKPFNIYKRWFVSVESDEYSITRAAQVMYAVR